MEIQEPLDIIINTLAFDLIVARRFKAAQDLVNSSERRGYITTEQAALMHVNLRKFHKEQK